MPERLEHVPGQAVREVYAQQLQLRESMQIVLGIHQSTADKGQPLYVTSMLSNSTDLMSRLTCLQILQIAPVTCVLPSAQGDHLP